MTTFHFFDPYGLTVEEKVLWCCFDSEAQVIGEHEAECQVAVVGKVYSLHDRLDLQDVDREGGAHTTSAEPPQSVVPVPCE